LLNTICAPRKVRPLWLLRRSSMLSLIGTGGMHLPMEMQLPCHLIGTDQPRRPRTTSSTAAGGLPIP
jgi:hypothetical protein